MRSSYHRCALSGWNFCVRCRSPRQCWSPTNRYAASSRSNPQAFSNHDGTYFSSMFRRTQSFNRVEFRYCSGDRPKSFTTCSNELSIYHPLQDSSRIVVVGRERNVKSGRLSSVPTLARPRTLCSFERLRNIEWAGLNEAETVNITKAEPVRRFHVACDE